MQAHDISVDMSNLLGEADLAVCPFESIAGGVRVVLSVDHMLSKDVVGHNGEGMGGWEEVGGEGKHGTQVVERHQLEGE